MEPIDADFSKRFLFPLDLEEFVPPDHPARFIREFVDCLVAEGVRFEWSEGCGDGRPPYAGALLCRVWLYGYLIGVTSSRKLEVACRDSHGMMWLAGMEHPDHNTLWRFWRANRAAIKRMFLSSVRLASESGMVGMVLHAVDGTKIQSRASNRNAWHGADLEKLLSRVEKQIGGLEEQISEAGGGGEQDRFEMPQRLADAKALREEIKEKLKILAEIERDHYNPADPEAQPMKLASGGTRLAYNGQVVVDDKSTIIVADDVVAEGYDQGQLHPMLDKTEENLGVLAEETVADGGYNTEQTIVEAEDKERSITVAAGSSEARSREEAPYHVSRFIYDEATDTYRCPSGQTLTFRRRNNKGGTRVVTEYRSEACLRCPVRAQCSSSKSGRTIERSIHQAAVERHRAKRRTPEGRARLKRRGAVVERVFACIKSNFGFTRFTVHGREGASLQWTWICTAHNLRILCARWIREAREALQRPRLATLAA